MDITVFTTDESCEQLGKFKLTHVTMSKRHELVLHFIDTNEQSKLMDLFVKKYVLFQVQGTKITLIPEGNNYQRVWFRFDETYKPFIV